MSDVFKNFGVYSVFWPEIGQLCSSAPCPSEKDFQTFILESEVLASDINVEPAPPPPPEPSHWEVVWKLFWRLLWPL